MSQWKFQHPSNFKMVSKIGAGSFGTVIKVVDEKGVEHALKRIRSYASIARPCQTDFARTVCREVETLSLLQGCANIVPLNKIYLSQDKLDVYMMTPYIQFDLKNVAETRTFTEDEIKWIAYQLLFGISQVHARKIVHRDLTLKNILISESFDTYIADFGLARAHESSSSRDGAIDVSNLVYRAPEMILQYKRCDTRVDMWSIGCIIAELFLRRRLFAPIHLDSTRMVIKFIQVLGKPDMEAIRLDASPSAYKFVEAMLAKIDGADGEARATGSTTGAYDAPIATQLAAAGASSNAIALVEALLQFDFRKRLSAAEAMQTKWFTEDEGYADAVGVGIPLPARQDHNTTPHEVTTSSEGATAAEEGSTNGDDEFTFEENAALRYLERANIDQLRAFMETKSEKIDNLIVAEYGSAGEE